VQIPANVTWNEQDVLTIVAQSTQVPGLQAELTRTTKAKAPILLVDDDRWFDFAETYITALEANNLPFDVWDTVTGDPDDSLTLAVLQQYPIVLWFNGYDWFNPLTSDEEAMIQAYLDGGGRFMLTSQEYLYNLPDHRASPFAQTYLGVFTHSEVLSSNLTIGVAGNPVGDGLGPYPLNIPLSYRNWTDTITPTETAHPAMLSQDGLANAVTHLGSSDETWHTAFFAFGLELLEPLAMAEVMNRTVGWLSWLGASTISTETTMAANNQTITYQATFTNDGPQAINSAAFTATFPYPLSLVSGTATGGLTEVNGALVWRGSLAKNESKTFTYQALVADGAPYGTLSRQISHLSDEDRRLAFERVVAVPVNVPAWSASTLTATPELIGLGDLVTYTLTLKNTGLIAAPLVTVSNQIPPYLQILTDTISQTPSSGTFKLTDLTAGWLTWQAPVGLHEPITLRYAAQLKAIPYPFQVTNVFTLDDAFAETAWPIDTRVIPYALHLPLIAK
jgi:uncharacterized repeat protein (TIGR01451 family)